MPFDLLEIKVLLTSTRQKNSKIEAEKYILL